MIFFFTICRGLVAHCARCRHICGGSNSVYVNVVLFLPTSTKMDSYQKIKHTTSCYVFDRLHARILKLHRPSLSCSSYSTIHPNRTLTVGHQNATINIFNFQLFLNFLLETKFLCIFNHLNELCGLAYLFVKFLNGSSSH